VTYPGSNSTPELSQLNREFHPRGMFRQLAFTNKICSNFDYWNTPSVLEIAIGRYYKFMSLISDNKSGKMLVPTLDIDLVWHCHQTLVDDYTQFTRALVGRLVDHDDDISSDEGNSGYTRTYMKWSKRYGEAYSNSPPLFNDYRSTESLRCIDPTYYYNWRKYSNPKSDIPVAVAIPTVSPHCVIGVPVSDGQYDPGNNISELLQRLNPRCYRRDATRILNERGYGGGGCGIYFTDFAAGCATSGT
jgi:Glycine-rich domain-containing protein-like